MKKDEMVRFGQQDRNEMRHKKEYEKLFLSYLRKFQELNSKKDVEGGG